MRVSTMMMFNNIVRNLAKSTERTQEIQEILSTGKKINRLSDDPVAVTKLLNYQTHLNKLGQYKENITYGNSWLNMSDSILQDMQNLLTEAKNIAIAQSTSTANSETRAQAAVAVQNLYEQLVSYANTKLGENYIFGGSITNIAPFNMDGTYNGNKDDLTVEIMEGIRTKINIAGSEFLVTDLNPVFSIAAATAGNTSSTGLVARNTNTILANPSSLSTYGITVVLENGLTQEITYSTDDSPTQDELGMGITDAIRNHDVLNQYIRASYDATTGNITFEAKEVGENGNQYSIDAANTTAIEGTVATAFAGGRSEITSGFVFDNTNSDIVFSENGGADITANIITDSGAVAGETYTGDQVASFIEQAMEAQSLTDPNGNSYTYTASYDESTNEFGIVNDAGNSGTLNLRWGAAGTTAEQSLGFNSVDSGAFAAGELDASDNQVEFNVLTGVNDRFSITVDGTGSGNINITAGAYSAASLATEMQNQINADAILSGAGITVTVDFGTTISEQFTITSNTMGANSKISLTSDTTDDFLETVGLDRDFEISGTTPTLLADLNGGTGVTAGNITITDRIGNSATITVNAGDTILDVINNINASAAIDVTAQLNPEGNGIDLIDNNGFPVQNLVVDDNATARDLGIVGNKPGAIYGTDLNPAVSSTTRINVLKGGVGLTLNAIRIVNGLSSERIDLNRARSITDVLTAIDDLGIDVTGAVNSSKTAIDITSTLSNTTAIVNEVDGETTASDLGIQGGTDFFEVLAVLQEALEKDDSSALLNILDQFDLILSTLVEKGSGVGARTNQLDAMNNRIVASETEISEIKSNIEDADMVEYLTKFTLQQTILQAMMSAAAQSIQTSLLNFLR